MTKCEKQCRVCFPLGVCPATVNMGVNVPSPGAPSPATAHTLVTRARLATPVSLVLLVQVSLWLCLSVHYFVYM